MSYIIGQPCVSTCDTACVAVCPVDCIHGPIDITGAGAEVANMSKEDIKGKMLYKAKPTVFVFRMYRIRQL